MRQIFLDTETTGLSPESGDRIVEIGCVEMVNRRLSGHDLHFYLNPERRNHDDAFAVHGLSDEFLADKPLFGQVADELLEYLAGAEIIIHNASFDVAFIDEELKRLGRSPVNTVVAKVTDSLLMARDAYPGKSNSLDALCKRFEVDNTKRTVHGALLDAGLLAEVYIRMTRGQDSLVIDAVDALAGGAEQIAIDYAAFDIVVIEADPTELEAHAALLREIDKASAGRAVWKAEVVAA